MLAKFFFSSFLIWLPVVFSAAILLVIICNHFFYHKKYLSFLKIMTTSKLTCVLIGGALFFNLLLTVLQYFVWRGGAFSSLFLPPYQPISYFLGYAFTHFWLADILAVISVLTFYLVLKLIRKYRADIISQEELNLFLLVGLLAGWPKFIILLPLLLSLALVFSVFNLLISKKSITRLSLPIILSLVIIFIFGNFLISRFSLSVLVM